MASSHKFVPYLNTIIITIIIITIIIMFLIYPQRAYGLTDNLSANCVENIIRDESDSD